MVQFCESEHTRSMRRYETNLARAKASNARAQADRRKSIEDELVEGGMERINKYIEILDKQWKEAGCLAEYDGLQMGYAIAKRAKARLQTD